MIKEQTPYFAHDFNATMDPKIQDMLFDLGPSGFVYWAIIETLWQQQGRYPLAKIRNIALIAHAKPSLIEKVIKDYGLFEYNDTEFWSPSQLARQEQRDSLIKSRQEAGRKGGMKKAENQQEIANGKQSYSNAKAEVEQKCSNKLNKTKLKETKEKESIDADASGIGSEGVLFPGMEPQKDIAPKEIMRLWNDILKETGAKLPKVQSLSEQRVIHINSRLRAFKERGNPLIVAERLIRRGCASSFLLSQRWFNFDWIFCAEGNWQKLDDGNYDDRPSNGATASGHDHLHVTATSPDAYDADF